MTLVNYIYIILSLIMPFFQNEMLLKLSPTDQNRYKTLEEDLNNCYEKLFVEGKYTKNNIENLIRQIKKTYEYINKVDEDEILITHLLLIHDLLLIINHLRYEKYQFLTVALLIPFFEESEIYYINIKEFIETTQNHMENMYIVLARRCFLEEYDKEVDLLELDLDYGETFEKLNYHDLPFVFLNKRLKFFEVRKEYGINYICYLLYKKTIEI